MTKAPIRNLLRTNNRAVEVALVRIFQRQTGDEQACSSTHWRNGRGFNAADAKRGSYFARWVRSGRQLTGHHLEEGRKLAMKYAGQLEEIAAEKRARRVLQPTVPNMEEVVELLDAARMRLGRIRRAG